MNSKLSKGIPAQSDNLGIAKNVTISGVSVYPAIFIIRCRLIESDKTVTDTPTAVAVTVILALYNRYPTHRL